MENNEILEGEKIDGLDGTSPSDEEKVPELNSSPVPTEEEKIEAGLETEEESDVVAETVEVETVEEPQLHEELGVLKFTQEDMDDLAGRIRAETRNKTFRYVYERYGVKDEQGLDDLFGNAQRYESLQEQYDGDKLNWKNETDARNKELADVKEQVALMQSGIDSNRYEDAKLILKGKGLEVSLENIQNELSTHPEWKKANTENPNFEKISSEPEGKISSLPVLGNENLSGGKETEEELVMKKLFKL